MSYRKSALVLIGSPRLTKSNSASMADYLSSRLQEKYMQTSSISLFLALRSNDTIIDLFTSVNLSQAIILVSPLYVDSLPYVVTRTMELLSGYRKSPDSPNQQFYAILNCGFPGAHNNDIALAICRRFAIDNGFRWSGGLGLGMGEVIASRPLHKIGRVVKNVTRALDLSAEAIAEGTYIPEEAISLIKRPLAPEWLYSLIAHHGWKRQAKKHGVKSKLNDKPLL